jgi:NAD(P)-dependent dehydrogenase (short-subunit alcohol dehydrogenase family)
LLSSGLSKTADLADPGVPVHLYPGVAYPASKTAVNTVTVQYAKAFPAIKINAVDPGYTATDLNGRTGTQTVQQGAQIIVKMAQTGPDRPGRSHRRVLRRQRPRRLVARQTPGHIPPGQPQPCRSAVHVRSGTSGCRKHREQDGE